MQCFDYILFLNFFHLIKLLKKLKIKIIMKIKLKIFGKEILSFGKNKGSRLIEIASSSDGKEDSKFLPDFFVSGSNDADSLGRWLDATERLESLDNKLIEKLEGKKEKEEKHLTPKEVYNLKLLNEEDFKIKTNPEYVDEQIKHFSTKLDLISSEEWDVRRGVEEIRSILIRFENRKKYNKEFDKFFSDFAYTTNTKIRDLVNRHDYLKIDKVAQFIADIPQEAVDVMKAYEKNTKKLCGKKPVFYIIADKKDFKNTETRRDPILLAQSPLGHFWQILGAWDEEMLFLEEL